MAETNRQWLLRRRPEGMVGIEDFEYREAPVPTPQDGEVLVRSLYFGYDASQRIWITEHGGYMTPVGIGEPMRTMGIGQVVASRHPHYAEGDLVTGFLSWQDYVIARADGPMPLQVLPKADYPLSWNLGVLGVGGLTAYFAVTDVLKVQPTDTVVISAATGATGSIAGDICKAMGVKRVIGIAGGAEKCKWITEKAHYDAAVDYKSPDFVARLHELCPDGVDAYFDNVGGDMLDTLLEHMAPRGRIVICGAMASGYTSPDVPGPKKYMNICTKMLHVQGILLLFYRDRLQTGIETLARWIAEGKIHVEEEVVEGFEHAPRLLPLPFSGKNPGKLILKIADPS
ncbi:MULTISPECIES: NADP-dependent oxidoreductase [Burkholderia]|uniref:NADP-dependent oxidoreductase n=1 Tax=Burkholderia TaxID=32008 RepID=UPI00078CA067|nr:MULTISPECIES: NADP-dependent oxidoreductase [Burkholderia]AMU04688.1 NADP-dependent oxidoreductase [Burkholderia cenocepacia]RQS24194.1 NADP-dependent oxidoreductase [Burkholderia sp. Bp8995]RQS38923.1 NADP-dependent oxidoreductase [Burkholderia sp. Bp8989]